MSNACFKALRAPRLASQLSSDGLQRAVYSRASGDTCFARFFTVLSGRNGCRPVSDQDENICRFPFVNPGFLRSFHYSPARQARRRDPKKASPAAGPSIPFGVFSAREIRSIFGYDVEQVLGNRVLRVLHQRRVDGSLLDYRVRVDDARVPEEASLRALKWLRSEFPVDEVAAGEAYTEREALKLQNSYISRAERLGLVKRMREEDEEDRAAEEQGTGYSVIDQMRKYNEKRDEKEAAAREASGEVQRSQELRLAKREEIQTRVEAIRERHQQAKLDSMITHAPDAPLLTRLRRLGPSTIAALAFVAIGVWAASTYEPPAYESRLWKSVPPSIATLAAIAAGCSLITYLWHTPITGLWRFMNKYLIAVPGSPYAVSLIGNVFSHQEPRHLAVNMCALAIFGIALHEMVGRGNFLAIYCIGGVMGSLTSMYYFVLRNQLNTHSVGASGAVFAIASAWAVLNLSRDTSHDTQEYFAVDVMRYCVLIIQIGLNFMPSVMKYTDVMAHAGGAVTGLIAAQWLKWRARASSPRSKETNAPQEGR